MQNNDSEINLCAFSKLERKSYKTLLSICKGKLYKTSIDHVIDEGMHGRGALVGA